MKNLSIPYRCAILCLFFLGSPADAHMDRILEYKKGEITGLPNEYLPARFDSNVYRLVIGNQVYQFPDFLVQIIKGHSKDPKIKFQAAWLDVAHPYISVRFEAAENDYIKCIFLLDDLSAISVSDTTPTPDGYRTDNLTFSKQQLLLLRAGLKKKNE